MDNLQGSGSSAVGINNPQGSAQPSLLPQSNSLQGLISDQTNLKGQSQNISIYPDCTQHCSLGVSTSAPAKNTRSISADAIGGALLLVGVVIVGIFAAKVLHS